MFGLGLVELGILIFLGLGVWCFIINVKLARSRGKSVAGVVLLTFFFSWLVTLILFFLPASKVTDENLAEQLRELKGLVEQGIIEQEEFDRKKIEILGRM